MTVVWKVTPLFAEWVASPNILFQAGYLSPDSTVLELGAGIAGIVALTLGPKIKKYIATDQDYVLRLLKQNIADNLPTPSKPSNKKATQKKKASQAATEQRTSNIEAFELDWELDSVSSLPALLGQNDPDNDDQGVDLVIACDCIYNEALIEPLNNTCAHICRLRSLQQHKPTLCLVAQQLRAPDVFESWLKSFHRLFHVWKVPDTMLIEELRENSGFIVHIGLVR
jgi:predicted nicotinamide N-methyase